MSVCKECQDFPILEYVVLKYGHEGSFFLEFLLDYFQIKDFLSARFVGHHECFSKLNKDIFNQRPVYYPNTNCDWDTFQNEMERYEDENEFDKDFEFNMNEQRDMEIFNRNHHLFKYLSIDKSIINDVFQIYIRSEDIIHVKIIRALYVRELRFFDSIISCFRLNDWYDWINSIWYNDEGFHYTDLDDGLLEPIAYLLIHKTMKDYPEPIDCNDLYNFMNLDENQKISDAVLHFILEDKNFKGNDNGDNFMIMLAISNHEKLWQHYIFQTHIPIKANKMISFSTSSPLIYDDLLYLGFKNVKLVIDDKIMRTAYESIKTWDIYDCDGCSIYDDRRIFNEISSFYHHTFENQLDYIYKLLIYKQLRHYPIEIQQRICKELVDLYHFRNLKHIPFYINDEKYLV